MLKLVDEFNTASKLAMVAQAKLGQEQLQAAEDFKKLLAAQDQVARKEEEVARMLVEVASMKLNVGELNQTYLTQQLQVQKAARELYTADALVREKMVGVNSCLLGGPRKFGEKGNDIRTKEKMKMAGEAALKEAEELLKEQQKAAKEAAQKAADAAVAAEKEKQKVAKLRSRVAALPERRDFVETAPAPVNVLETAPAPVNVLETAPAPVNVGGAAPGNVVVATTAPRFTGTRPKEPVVPRPLGARGRNTANKGNRIWPDNINLPVKIGLVKVVEDHIPGSHEQYK